MKVSMVEFSDSDSLIWDQYVRSNKISVVYHLWNWKRVIENTYGHQTFYIAAVEDGDVKKIVGVLPLAFIKHFVFGKKLISIPYFDMGGIIADSEDIEKKLIEKSISIAECLNADTVELRHTERKDWLEKESIQFDNVHKSTDVQLHKVRMILELPDSSEALMSSFKSKLRSQIKKPLNEGLTVSIGGIDQLNVFYKIFVENMRDLGSPVHSKKMIENTLIEFGDDAKTVIIFKGKEPVAGSIIIGFKGILANPWSSSLRRFNRYSPNMLLYWAMLEYASDHGFKWFDFGRSTPGEGTFKFKEQWGAKPQPLFWHTISIEPIVKDQNTTEKDRFGKAIEYWKKLPISVTRIVGPRIRKYIGL